MAAYTCDSALAQDFTVDGTAGYGAGVAARAKAKTVPSGMCTLWPAAVKEPDSGLRMSLAKLTPGMAFGWVKTPVAGGTGEGLSWGRFGSPAISEP